MGALSRSDGRRIARPGALSARAGSRASASGRALARSAGCRSLRGGAPDVGRGGGPGWNRAVRRPAARSRHRGDGAHPPARVGPAAEGALDGVRLLAGRVRPGMRLLRDRPARPQRTSRSPPRVLSHPAGKRFPVRSTPGDGTAVSAYRPRCGASVRPRVRRLKVRFRQRYSNVTPQWWRLITATHTRKLWTSRHIHETCPR